MKLPPSSHARLTLRLIHRQPFSTTLSTQTSNRLLDSIRTPPTFHDYLRSSSANNTLFLALFTSSACTPCRTITPLLKSIIESRSPKPADSYSRLAFAEVELDSPDTSNGSIYEIGMIYGINNLPTLVGFGGRRAERVTERIVDTKMMGDKRRMEGWIDEEMAKGDQHPSEGGGKSLLQKIFG